MVKRIPLSQGKFALVDDEDYEFLMKFKWSFHGHYAVREEMKKRIYMHRLVAKTPDGMDTDHINRDRLDNRKKNLRICTRSQNNCNKIRSFPNKTSKYRGVSYDAERKKWKMQMGFAGKKIIKRFKTEIDAALFYNEKAKEHHGDFAILNKIGRNANVRV